MTTIHKHRNHHHDAWTCRWCGEVFAVPVLARDCEASHENEGDDE